MATSRRSGSRVPGPPPPPPEAIRRATYRKASRGKGNMSSDTHVTDLPVEVILDVFSYLTPGELGQLVSPVCAAWASLASDNSLWKPLVEQEWPQEDWNNLQVLTSRRPGVPPPAPDALTIGVSKSGRGSAVTSTKSSSSSSSSSSLSSPTSSNNNKASSSSSFSLSTPTSSSSSVPLTSPPPSQSKNSPSSSSSSSPSSSSSSLTPLIATSYKKYFRDRVERSSDLYSGHLPSREYHVVVIGSRRSGKSALVNRLLRQEFSPEFDPSQETPSCYHRLMTVDDELRLVHVWDGLFGSVVATDPETWRHIRRYPFAPSGAIITYDATSHASYDYARTLLTERTYVTHMGDRIPLVLVATKCESSPQSSQANQRRLSREVGAAAPPPLPAPPALPPPPPGHGDTPDGGATPFGVPLDGPVDETPVATTPDGVPIDEAGQEGENPPESVNSRVLREKAEIAAQDAAQRGHARVISEAQGRELAAQAAIPYLEVSSLNGSGVTEVFAQYVREVDVYRNYTKTQHAIRASGSHRRTASISSIGGSLGGRCHLM